MDRRSRWLALGAGFVIGGIAAAAFGMTKGQELTLQGRRLATSLGRQGAELETYLASQGTRLSAELERLAQAEAERSARQSADDYMARVFGLTPERIAGISRLSSAISPLTELF
jgi:hypothetical protein